MSTSLNGAESAGARTADGPLVPTEWESTFDAHPDVKASALVSVGVAGRQEPVMCVALRGEYSAEARDQIARELRQMASERPTTRRLKAILFHPGFSVGGRRGAEIDRTELATWAEAQLGRDRRPAAWWRTASVRLVPVAGWLFIVFGFVWPLSNPILRGIWFLDLFLSVGVHSLQLFISVPRGKRAGYSAAHAVIYTLAFGAAWWKFIQPIPIGVYALEGDTAPSKAS